MAANEQIVEVEKVLVRAQDHLDGLDSAADAAAISPDVAQTRLNTAVKAKIEAEVVLSLAQASVEAAKAVAEKANKAKEAADKRAKEAMELAKAKDVNVTVSSTPIMIKIIEAPITLTAGPFTNPMKAETVFELPVTIKRLYDFAGPVEILLNLPEGLEGVKAEAVIIDKDNDSAVLKIEATPEALSGRLEWTVQARLKFNGQDLNVSQKVSNEPEKIAKSNGA